MTADTCSILGLLPIVSNIRTYVLIIKDWDETKLSEDDREEDDASNCKPYLENRFWGGEEI